MNSLVVKRPLWYSGGILPRSREFQDQTQQSQLQIYELNGHELDEIIDEKLTNSELHGRVRQDSHSFWASVEHHR